MTHYRQFFRGGVLAALVIAISIIGLQRGNMTVKAMTNTCQPDNTLYIGSFGYGVNCLDADGWKTFDESNSSLQSAQVKAVAACPDGTTWVANSLGLLKIGKDAQEKISLTDAVSSIEALACDGKGGVWAAHFKGVSHFAAGKWDTTDSSKLGSGESVSLVTDVAVDSTGKVYVVTSNSVATYDGTTWTVYEQGKGFDQQYFLVKIALDSKGQAYVGEGSGVLIFDGKTWKEQKDDSLTTITSVAVDSKGVVWLGTYSQGVARFDSTGWTTFDSKNNNLSFNHVNALAIDAQDRLWVGTEYGLNIFDGKQFTAYEMANSDLVDNDIKALVVTGKGPALPKMTTKDTGSMSGLLLSGSNPVPDATVEICTVFVPSSFTGDTPCADQPGNVQVKSGSDGKFAFDKLPVGHYGLVVQGPDQKWGILSDGFGVNSKADVSAGKNTDVGSIDLSKKAK